MSYQVFQLDNGLTAIHHPDVNTPMVAVNLLYNVGARDEDPDHTGFAHLFEHLMFGGTTQVPSFDTPLQLAGAENNAFTTNDITNYYEVLSTENVEIALWLESDRMQNLDINLNSLNIQKQVVIEEFKQRYLNQPYGDAHLHLRPLAYIHHPYRWATIGKDISHIENAKLSDVESFFHRYYNPSNACLCIAGNLGFERTQELVQKWFGGIPAGEVNQNIYPSEPKQSERRFLAIESDVPQDAIYMAFHMAPRSNRQYYAADLISDILARNESSRLNQRLVKDKPIFTNIHAYISGETDAGLFHISGRLADNISFEQAEEAIWKELSLIASGDVGKKELDKVKNKFLTAHLFNRVKVAGKALALCMAQRLGDIALYDTEMGFYAKTNTDDIKTCAEQMFKEDNLSVINYCKPK